METITISLDELNEIKNRISLLEDFINSLSGDQLTSIKVLAKRVKKDSEDFTKQKQLLQKIMEISALNFGITIDDMREKVRTGVIPTSRQLVAFFGKKYTLLSAREIGFMLNFSNHSTVAHSCKTVESDYVCNRQSVGNRKLNYRDVFNKIEAEIKNVIQ